MRRLLIVALAALLGVLFWMLSGPTGPGSREGGVLPGDAADAYEAGVTHLEAGRVEQALDHLEEAHRRAPDAPEVTRSLATCLRKLGRWDEAARELQGVRDRAPDPGVDLELGFCLLMSGRLREAIEPLEAHVDEARDGVRARSLLGQIHRALGDLDAAIRSFRAFVDGAPDQFEARGALLDLQAARDGREVVVEAARAAHEANPGDPLLRWDLAWVLRSRPAEALEVLEPAAGSGGAAQGAAHALASDLLLRMGRPDEALARARRAVEAGRPRIASGEPTVLLARGRVAEAGQLWQEARRRWPRIDAVHHGMAEAQVLLGDAPAAVRTLEEALEAGLGALPRASVLEDLGYARLDDGDPAGAREAFDRLRRLGEGVSRWRHRAHRGEAFARALEAGETGDLGPARRAMTRALGEATVPEDRAYTLLWAGMLAEVAGAREEARDRWREATELLRPLEVAVASILSDLLLGNRTFAGARRALEPAGPRLRGSRAIARALARRASGDGEEPEPAAIEELPLVRPWRRRLGAALLRRSGGD